MALVWRATFLGILVLLCVAPALAVDTDGDGIDDADDNCPFVINPVQRDADDDGIGNACEICPTGASDDEQGQGDGFNCYEDNCPDHINPGQEDADRDGLGDVCDACPFDPADDVDQDGACGDVDVCPSIPDPQLGQIPISKAGSPVTSFQLGEDDTTVSYQALNVIGTQLHKTTILGNPIDHGPESEFISRVGTLAPNGSRMVYREFDFLLEGGELFSIPVNGGAPVSLSGPGDIVTSLQFTITPDSSTVVYEFRDHFWLPNELYSIPIGGGPSVKLVTIHAWEGVLGHRVSPDSAWVVFGTDDPDGDEPFSNIHLKSVPLLGGQVMTLVTEGQPFGGAPTSVGISPDSAWVSYRKLGDLFTIPIEGGEAIQLNPPLTPDQGVRDYEFTPDSEHVVYVADQEIDDVRELFVVPTVGGTPVKLNDPMPGSSPEVGPFAITPDGSRVVYAATADGAGNKELYSVPTLGGAPAKLTSLPVSDILDLRIDSDGARVAYRPAGASLYSVSTFNGPPVSLSGPSVEVQPDYSFSPQGDFVVFRSWYDSGQTQEMRLERVPAAGGLSEIVATTGEFDDFEDFEVLEGSVVYRANLTGAHDELFVEGQDANGNGIVDFCETCFGDGGADPDGDGCGDSDNCPTVHNPEQSDSDGDGDGDVCDLCPTLPTPTPDSDGDLHGDSCDNCLSTPNPSQRDLDADGFGDACDCAIDMPHIFAPPSEVTNFRFASKTRAEWDPVAPVSGPATRAQIMRGVIGEWPVGTGLNEECLAPSWGIAFYLEDDHPPPGVGHYYLVRGTNLCGIGTYGDGSDAERATSICAP